MKNNFSSGDYLTISQAAKACSVSRATLLRLEADGFITPAQQEENGYRYYDSYNIYRILQILGLQDVGLSRKELPHELYGEQLDRTLEKMEQRLEELHRQVRSLRAQLTPGKHLSIRWTAFPSRCLYIRPVPPPLLFNKLYEGPGVFDRFFLDAAREGYPLAWNSSVCLVVWDPERLFHPTDGTPGPCSYGLLLREEIHDANTIILPSVRVLCTLWYGPYQGMQDAFQLLQKTLEKNGKTPCGPAQLLSIIGPHTGREIPSESYITEVCVPYEIWNKP